MAWRARLRSWPRRCQISSEMCGANGASSSVKFSASARDGGELAHLVIELDQFCNCGVKAQAGDVFADFFDGAVHLPVDGVGNGAIDHAGTGHRRFVVTDQVTPNGIEEPKHADDISRVPRLLIL